MKFFQNLFRRITHKGFARASGGSAPCLRDELEEARNNFCLFQKAPNFLYPEWVEDQVASGSEISTYCAPLLRNRTSRDALRLSNFISDDSLLCMDNGTLQGEGRDWTLEIWLWDGDTVIRLAQEARKKKSCALKGGPVPRWECSIEGLGVEAEYYGVRIERDEMLFSLKATGSKKKNRHILFVFRPCTIDSLGTLGAIQFLPDSGQVKINNRAAVILEDVPDIVKAGNLESQGLDMEGEDSHKVSCASGMATMAFGYLLPADELRLNFRISLSGSHKASASRGDFDLEAVRKEYRVFAERHIKTGYSLEGDRKEYRDLLHNVHLSMLQSLGQIPVPSQPDGVSSRRLYFILKGMSMLGHRQEVFSILSAMPGEIGIPQSIPEYQQALGIAYLISIFADYYHYFRDGDYFREVFPFLRKQSGALMQYTSRLKDLKDVKENTVDYLYVSKPVAGEIAVFVHAMRQYALIARNLGIFGDETRFSDEAKRLEEGIVSLLSGNDSWPSHLDYPILYPFSIIEAGSDKAREIMGEPPGKKEIACYVPGIGYDVRHNLILVNVLLREGDPSAQDLLENLRERAGSRMTLTSLLDPSGKRGIGTVPDDPEIAALMAITLRNRSVMDEGQRLTIFPVPDPNLFQGERDLELVHVVTRFGTIDLQVSIREREIQISFGDVPRFMPADILINLPVSFKAIPSDEFIIKHQFTNSVLISGWPEIIHCRRRSTRKGE